MNTTGHTPERPIAFDDKKYPEESAYEYNRRMAKKYDLDFEHKCVFDEQLKPLGGYPKEGALRNIKMNSGKTAEYKCIMTKTWGDSAQQHDWLYEFQRYVD